MFEALISVPKKKSVKKFWHPESQELILSAASITTAFIFWNTINIRPSMLTDPGYQEQKEGLQHHMNLSLAVILGISAAFSLIYGKQGYLAALAAASTGVTMYIWTSAELNRPRSGESYPSEWVDVEPMGLKVHTEYPAMYRPMEMGTTALKPKKRRETAAMG